MISDKDAARLAQEDSDKPRYEFVPYAPASPLSDEVERIVFEQWAGMRGFDVHRQAADNGLGQRPYVNPITQGCWSAWLGRAASIKAEAETKVNHER